jgi:hypothetical protein
MKLGESIDGVPALLVDRRCTRLINAFEGGYRYGSTQSELPMEEHPYEDTVIPVYPQTPNLSPGSCESRHQSTYAPVLFGIYKAACQKRAQTLSR